MAAETLKHLKELGKYTKSTDSDTRRSQFPVEPVIVIDINRYLTDPSSLPEVASSNNDCYRNTSEKAVPSVDVYDVTLADWNSKMKVRLASPLHHLVQQAKMVVGSIVEVIRSGVIYDETNLQDDGILVLCDVSVVGYATEDIAALNDLPWYPENSVRQTEYRPLTSGRGCYLNLWTSSDVIVPQTIPLDCEEVSEQQLADVYTIAEVITKSRNLHGVKPALLVRVVRKSRLLHFGKPDKVDKWPFQHQLLVADRSGVCTLVFWNSLALQFLTTVEEGTVLFLRDFSVKRTFLQNQSWYYSNPNLKVFDFDLNLNPHHPAAKVRVVDQESLPRTSQLPELTYNFVTRCQIGSLPDNFVCDVTGVVTYTSHVMREAIKSKQYFDSGRFWLWRWIHVMDSTSNSPVILQLYRTNQCSVFDELRPGELLVCRHMRVVHNVETITSSRQRRHVYLTSTAVSQYYTYHPARSNRAHQFVKEPVVKDLRSWRKRLNLKSVTFRTGGYYSYPPMPVDKQEVLKSPITITPSGDQWIGAVRNLAFREQRVLYVQAKLIAVWTNRTKDRIEVDGLDIDPSLTIGMDLEFENDAELFPKEFNPQTDQVERDFPPTFDRNRGSGAETGRPSNTDCLCVLWMGLNRSVTLHTVKPLACQRAPHNVTFLNIVTGKYDSDSLDHSQISNKVLDRCLSTAKDVFNQRFLLVIDLYRTSASSVKIVLKRAFLL